MRIDHLELKKLDRLRQNIHVVAHPLFNRALLVKFTEFPWQIPFFEAETTAYNWIDGQGVGTSFLGHLTEAGRVIGFVMEYIKDAKPADTGDLAACQDVLAKLHSLGIKHGDINKNNFLVREGKAVLIDFETARRCTETKELKAEYDQLEHSLSDSSCGGGASS
jgi:serine/threonine protein kinase